MLRHTRILLASVLAITASHATAQLGPEWFGTWKSQDGHTTKKISATRIDESFDPRGKKDMPEAHNTTLHWTNKSEDLAGELSEVFGCAKKPLSPDDISSRYEKALREHKKNPSDFKVGDTAKSRQAINSIAPGVYKVMWSYGFGDCDFEEHLVDGDKMLVVSDCPYGFGVKLFNRVR